MAIAMSMEWQGVSPEQYERVMERLGLDERPPEGGLIHISGFTEGTLHVLDVWESPEAWDRFSQGRLAQAVQEAGVSGEPKVLVYPVHNIYAPGADEIARAGASSLPSVVLRA